MKQAAWAAILAVLLKAPPAIAGAPGLDSKVYGTGIESGVTEIEARYGRLTGKSGNGTSALVLEVSHGFSPHFYGALLTTIEHEPGFASRASSVGFEGIYRVGTIVGTGVDVAVYGEYSVALHDEPHNIEFKALFEKTAGRLDTRLNLIAERLTQSGAPLAFSYAASADYAITDDEFKLGAAAFGDLGDSDRFGGRQPHFIGPQAKIEVEHLPGNSELHIETAYLFAIGAARDTARGQARIGLELEFHF